MAPVKMSFFQKKLEALKYSGQSIPVELSIIEKNRKEYGVLYVYIWPSELHGLYKRTDVWVTNNRM